tara:strand:+ start:1217 stop:2122 length:906 start_codon:yes stop_codon:yes gene_type:complete
MSNETTAIYSMPEATILSKAEPQTNLERLQSQLSGVLESIGKLSEEKDGTPPTSNQLDRVLGILNDIDHKIGLQGIVKTTVDHVGTEFNQELGEIDTIIKENVGKIINYFDSINGSTHSTLNTVVESLKLLAESNDNITTAVENVELDTSTLEVDLNVNDYGLEVSLDSSQLESSVSDIEDKLENLSEKMVKTSHIMKMLCMGIFIHPDSGDKTLREKVSEGDLSVFGESKEISIYDMIRKMSTWMAIGSQVQSRILDSVEAQQELIKDNTKTMERLGQLIGTNLNTTNNLLKDVIEGLRS